MYNLLRLDACAKLTRSSSNIKGLMVYLGQWCGDTVTIMFLIQTYNIIIIGPDLPSYTSESDLLQSCFPIFWLHVYPCLSVRFSCYNSVC